MNDMSQVIVPKSDQISADDFIAGPRTYTIADVEIRPGTEQPVSIFMEGEPRAWRPCKSMSRCLVAAWGPDAGLYRGRSVTLYRDPKVKWGGMEVGGIRVSHMSHIERDMLLQLTATKGKRSPHVVKPLADQPAPKTEPAEPKADNAAKWADNYCAKVANCPDAAAVSTFTASASARLEELKAKRPELAGRCTEAVDARLAEIVRAETAAMAEGADDFGDLA